MGAIEPLPHDKADISNIASNICQLCMKLQIIASILRDNWSIANDNSDFTVFICRFRFLGNKKEACLYVKTYLEITFVTRAIIEVPIGLSLPY